MAHIEKRITKAGKARYTATVRVPGFPTKCATFAKHGDARDWAQAIESDMRAGRYGGAIIARKYTVGDMIQRYLDNVLESKSDRQNYVKSQRQQLEWWKTEIGQYSLVHLQPLLLSQCKDKLAGRNYNARKPATVRRYFSALNHVINTAITQWQWLQSNPIAQLELPQEPRGRIRFLTDEERLALIAACRCEHRIPLYQVVMFALCTGARKGEILSLRVSDVDLARMTAVAYDTKNGEPRTLYLSEYVRDMIRDMPTHRRGPARLVFTSRSGGRINIEYAWRKALKRAGISNFRFHDLRHTAASYLAMNGATPSDIGEVLGHKSYDMVKRYSHLSATHVAGVVRSMNSAMIQQGETTP